MASPNRRSTWEALKTRDFQPRHHSRNKQLILKLAATRRGLLIADFKALYGIGRHASSMSLEQKAYENRKAKIKGLGVILQEDEELGPCNKAELLTACHSRQRDPNDTAESVLLLKLSSQILNLSVNRNAEETAREISQLLRLKADITSGIGALPALATMLPKGSMPPPYTHFYEAVNRDLLPLELVPNGTGDVATNELLTLPTFFFHTVDTSREMLSMELMAGMNGVYGARAVDRVRRFVGSHIVDSDEAIVLSATWVPRNSLFLHTARFHEGTYKLHQTASFSLHSSAQIKTALISLLNAQDWAREKRDELMKKVRETAGTNTGHGEPGAEAVAGADTG